MAVELVAKVDFSELLEEVGELANESSQPFAVLWESVRDRIAFELSTDDSGAIRMRGFLSEERDGA